MIITNKKKITKLSIKIRLYSNMMMLQIHWGVKGLDDKIELNLKTKMTSIYLNIFFFLFRAFFFIKMFLHYITDIYDMQDRRTNLTTIMIDIFFLLFIPWRTFAYGTFIFMWPWKEADHSSRYISWIIFFGEY